MHEGVLRYESVISVRLGEALGEHMYNSNGLLTYLLTYSMEQIPSWEANQVSDSQEIPHILWNTRVHYRIHKCVIK